jgi:hypothetical protein
MLIVVILENNLFKMNTNKFAQATPENVIDITAFNEVANLLSEAKAANNEELKADLVNALVKIGVNDTLIHQIQTKGLPSEIAISNDIFDIAGSFFAKYAPLRKMNQITKCFKGLVLVIWADDFETITITDDFGK